MKAAAACINKPCALPYTVDRIIRRRKKEGGKSMQHKTFTYIKRREKKDVASKLVLYPFLTTEALQRADKVLTPVITDSGPRTTTEQRHIM
jgi:hypothetical protein